MKTAVDQYLLFSYRADLDVLFLRWPVSVNSEELRAGYMHALQEATLLRAKNWLFDVRIRGKATEADIAWLFSTFIPLTEERMGMGNGFAYLVSPTYYAFVEKKVGLKKLEECSKFTKIRMFVSEREALQWLAGFQKKNQ